MHADIGEVQQNRTVLLVGCVVVGDLSALSCSSVAKCPGSSWSIMR